MPIKDFMLAFFMANVLVLGTVVVVTSCGDSYPDEGAGGPPAADPAYDQIRPLVDKNCGVCHNGKVHPLVLDSGAKFKKASARLKNGTMPPAPRKVSPDDKAKMLKYAAG